MSKTHWRPKTRVAKLRERIRIERATIDNSTGQPEKTWSALYESEPAAYDPARGSETVNGRQVEANITVVFIIHYHDDISPEQRVQFDGVDYGIVSALGVDGGRRYMELHCKAGV